MKGDCIRLSGTLVTSLFKRGFLKLLHSLLHPATEKWHHKDGMEGGRVAHNPHCGNINPLDFRLHLWVQSGLLLPKVVWGNICGRALIRKFTKLWSMNGKNEAKKCNQHILTFHERARKNRTILIFKARLRRWQKSAPDEKSHAVNSTKWRNYYHIFAHSKLLLLFSTD